MSSHGSAEVFHPEARLEFIQACEHYRNLSPELGQKFVATFREVPAGIGRFPEAAPEIHPMGIRRAQMKKFPYNVVYLLDPDAVFIIAVAHQSRHPDYWLRRLVEPGRE